MTDLKGKWALVTGSSRGIGRQIALGLAQRGVNIIVHGRTMANAEATRQLLAPKGVQTACICGSLDSDDGARGIVEQARAVADIDILYNNAAIQNEWKEVWDIAIDEWKALFQINFFSQVIIANGLLPGMVKRGWGRAIILTSGIPDIPQLSPYGASKWAVNKYVFDMAAQLRGSGVTIHALDPGWLRTDLGGPEGEHPVEAVLPGALVPVITDNVIPSGAVYRAQDYRGL